LGNKNLSFLKGGIYLQWRKKAARKSTGGKYHKNSKKHKIARGRDFHPVAVGEAKKSINRTRGGNIKIILLKGNIANVAINDKIQKTKIISVIENSADSHFVRSNIITRGAIIQTELGPARVTSRPGQEGIVNAILVDKKKI